MGIGVLGGEGDPSLGLAVPEKPPHIRGDHHPYLVGAEVECDQRGWSVARAEVARVRVEVVDDRPRPGRPRRGHRPQPVFAASALWSAASVCWPQIPSAVSPEALWKLFTAACVAGPYDPSAFPGE